jgi:hypothetical protein
MRLQEMGIITPDVRTKMEDLQAAGAKNIEVWEVLATRLAQFKGGMAQLSQTGDGLVSTLKDTWTQSVRTFGQSFLEVSKTAIGGLIEWLGKLNDNGTIKSWADKTLEVLYRVAGAARAVASGGGMRAEAWSGIKDVLIGGLEVGAQKVTSLLEAAAPRIGALIGSAAKAIMTVFKQEDFKAAAKDLGLGEKVGFWGGAFGESGRLSKEENLAVQKRMREIRQKRDLEEGGFSAGDAPTSTAQARLDRGLATLRKLGSGFRQSVDDKTKELKDAAEAPPDPQAAKKKAEEEEKIKRDMAAAQAIKDEKAAKERAQAEAEERRKLALKNAEDEHARRVANIREEAQVSAQSESATRDRLSRANIAAQQAWGWYRDPESFKRQLAEEKANAAAEKQYAKDFDKLNDRRDWRTTTRLTDSEESVRRVALAREEQDRAQKALIAIEKNTAGLEDMLKTLLTVK